MKYLLPFILSTSCGYIQPICEGYCSHYYDLYNYEVNAVEKDGLQIDAPEDYNTEKLSQLVDKIDQCLKDIGTLPREEAVSGWCLYQKYEYQPIRKSCFEIKISTDWQWSEDGKYQMLYDEAPFEGCKVKGFEDGKCYWRDGVQDGYKIIVPPDAQLFGRSLLKVATGCYAPYSSPMLTRCAQISVGWMGK